MKSLVSRPHFAPLALLFALCLLFWSRVLLGGEVLLPGAMLGGFAPFGGDPRAPWTILQWDALAQYFPWRHFAAQSLQSGHIPLWNPFQFCGTPFMANAQSAIFYPLNLPFWVFDTARAFGIAAFAHSILASFSTYFLARRWNLSRAAAVLAGAIYAFCGYLSAWSLLPTLFATAAWLPLCLLLFERASDDEKPGASSLLLALSLSCALLAGHAQVFFYILLALALRQPFLKRKWRGLAILGGALGLALLLGALQVVPTLELARIGHRVAVAPTPADWKFWQDRALGWSELGALVFPAEPTALGTLSENFGYLGFGAILLGILGLFWTRKDAAKAPDARTFSVEESAEEVSHQSEALRAENSIRLGREPIGDASPTSRLADFFASRPKNFAFALAIFGLLYALATPLSRLIFFAIPGVSQMGGTGRALLLWSLGVALLAGFGLDFVRARFPHRWLAPLALLLVVGELSFNSYLTLPTAPRAAIYPPTTLTTFLAKNSSPQARVLMLTPRNEWLPREAFRPSQNHPSGVLPPNGATVYGIYDVNGYDSLSLRQYRAYIGGASPALNGNMVLLDSLAPVLLDELGVRYVVTLQNQPPATEPGRRVLSADGCDVWERQINGQLRVSGQNFAPGTRDGKYQPTSFRFGAFVSLCALGFVAAAWIVRRGGFFRA